MARTMKDSGIDLIGMIPAHWDIKKAKYIASSFQKGNGITKEEIFLDGDTQCVRYGEIYSKYEQQFTNTVSLTKLKEISSPRYIYHGDILFAGTGELVEEIGKNIVFLGSEPCLAGGDIIIMKHSQNPIFMNYALNSIYSQQQKSRGKAKLKVVHISATDIGNILIALPPINEQEKIADFLDDKVGEINAIIHKTKTSIEEYKKYRKSIVIKAVTKGLRLDVPMKKTDSDWIEEIPAHWDYVRIQRLFETVDERNEDENALLLSLYTALGVKPRNELEEKGNKASTVMNYKKVQKNDVIVNKLLAWMGAIGYSDYEGVTSPDYDVYRARKGANVVRNYYNEYFRNTCFNGDCYKYGHGIMLMRWRTYPEEFLRIRVPNPPLVEQQEIADYLAEKCGEIDALIAKKEAFVEEMEAYKKSLIYEYVTGKKEV